MLLKIYRLAAVVLLPLFFWFFHRGVLGAHLGPDEPMNLYTYWAPPLWKTVLANVTFWGHFNRPLAAMYYLPLYRAFGLNAAPYNLVRNLILLVNVGLFYQLAFRVSRSRWVALLASFPIAYHAALGYLAWGGAFIYDALCGGFYFAALLYYMRGRKAGRRLGVRQVSLFLVLYIFALDSKEMAVTLPVLVLAYELLFQKLARDSRGLAAQFLPTLISGAVTLVFILGKTGRGTLTDMEAYRPVFTWARFSESSIHLLNEIFYVDTFTMRGVVILWALLLAIGLFRFRDPRWMFLWVWVMVAPLPIVFLPGRGGAQQYIVVAGWSIAVALICRALVLRLAWAWKAVGLPRSELMAGSLLLCAGLYAQETRTADEYQRFGFRKNGEQTLVIIEQLKALRLQPKPGSRIVFLTDPFPGSYDMQFIANLVWNDHSLRIELQQEIHFTEEALARMDYLLDYADGRLRVLRTPQ